VTWRHFSQIAKRFFELLSQYDDILATSHCITSPSSSIATSASSARV
jgi:hypothetical protein